IFLASHMLYEITEICNRIALINQGSIIAFDSLENLEHLLRTREIICEITRLLPLEKRDKIITRLIQNLKPYLDSNLDPSISKELLVYNSDEKSFTIYYDGKEESKKKILEIMVNEFTSDFTINSFSNPKTSQLERLYSQIIDNKRQKSK
ncbi:hypothetical protein LCGC14_0943580, partial [marine sediment metagenome]